MIKGICVTLPHALEQAAWQATAMSTQTVPALPPLVYILAPSSSDSQAVIHLLVSVCEGGEIG